MNNNNNNKKKECEQRKVYKRIQLQLKFAINRILNALLSPTKRVHNIDFEQ